METHPYKLADALREGANPNARREDDSHSTPLSFLLRNTSANTDAHSIKKAQGMVDALLMAGADPTLPTQGELPYQTVAKLDHRACTEKLFVRLLRGVDKTAIDTELDHKSKTTSALGHAFHSRNVGRARELMTRGADPWKPLPDGQPCWVLLGRTNWKSIDRHRQPQPARLMREIAKQRSAREVLDVVVMEAELLRERVIRCDSYGTWAMELVQGWMVAQAELTQDDLHRLAKCAEKGFKVPVKEMLQAGLDPNFLLPEGRTVAWRLLESEDEEATGILMEHPHLDMTTTSSSGEDMASFLRKARWLDVQKETREKWISRVEAQLLARSTPHPTQGSKPRSARL